MQTMPTDEFMPGSQARLKGRGFWEMSYPPGEFILLIPLYMIQTQGIIDTIETHMC